MPDREKVISEFEYFVKSFSKRDDTYYKGLFISVLSLLKEQEKEISIKTENFNRLVAKVGVMPKIVLCKDCKWYDERISICDNCGLPREQTFFCRDGKLRT